MPRIDDAGTDAGTCADTGRAAARRRLTGRLGATALLTMTLAGVLPAGTAFASADPHQGASATSPDLGANVVVFDPSMPQAEIQARVNAIYAQQVDNEMGTARYALL